MIPAACSEKISVGSANFPARVLIVDDELLIRWSLVTGLRLAGFEALAASDREEALAVARMLPHPDVAVIDSCLYDTNLISLLRELEVVAPECQVLLMTTSKCGLPYCFGRSAGIIRKPFDLPDVVRLVNATIAPCFAASDSIEGSHSAA
jgi:DNA-binding NtrC family response regulator